MIAVRAVRGNQVLIKSLLTLVCRHVERGGLLERVAVLGRLLGRCMHYGTALSDRVGRLGHKDLLRVTF